jgi:hypothetical protein
MMPVYFTGPVGPGAEPETVAFFFVVLIGDAHVNMTFPL